MMFNTDIDFFKRFIKTDEGVEELIKQMMQHGQQNIHTPFALCKEMIAKLIEYCDINDKKIAVLFNIEFLHVLVTYFKVNPDNIVMFSDNEVEKAFCELQYGLKPNVNLFKIDMEKTLETKKIYTNVGEVNMKFDVVVMNPPYQQSDGGHSRSAKPIYHSFIEKVIDELSPEHFVCVNPSRWMMGGKGLDVHRNRMMNDCHIRVMVDDMSPSGIFPSVDIAGGVNYWVWDKNYNGKCLFNGVERFLNEEDIVIRENESRLILAKVKKKCNDWISASVSPRKPYGLQGNAKVLKNGVPCWFKQSIGLAMVDSSDVKNPRHDVHLWRVLVPRAPIAGQTDFSKPIGFFNDRSIVVAKPNEYCTETFLVLKAFSKEAEARNFVSYIKTKFFRFMLRMRVISQDVTRENYNWVPDLGDYSKPWSDEELYKMFDLNKKDIDFIESKIKEFV